MTRITRTAVVVLVLAIAAMSPAAAAKKKKPKPWRSEDVTLLVAHPIQYSQTGQVNSVTAQEFEANCDTPSTNGLDAYVFEIPKAYQKINAFVDAKGSATVMYDLDIVLYDKNCEVTLTYQTPAPDESGTILKGTVWILIHNYLGEPGATGHIELRPT